MQTAGITTALCIPFFHQITFPMKKYILTLSFMLSLTTAIWAQEKGITPEMLQQMRLSQSENSAERAIEGAVHVNGIKQLATVPTNAIPGGTYFSNEIKSKGITDQKRSGRCWLFTGLNVLRAKMIQKYNLGSFTLSQNYVSFYDQLEKCNLFLQAVIDRAKLPMDDRSVEWLFKNPLSDGGQFTGVSDLIMKYGVVPSECMPETFCSENTSTYAMLVKEKLREFGLRLREEAANGTKTAALIQEKQKMMGELYAILVRCLGQPPVKFTWTRTDASGKPLDTREYTPQSFYQEYIGNDLKGNYLMFMNDPSKPFYKTYEIDLDRHVYDGNNWVFLNLPMEELKEMAISSIKDSTMVYLSCDVGKYSNSSTGYNDPGNYNYADVIGTTLPMDKAQRIKTFASASTHAMSLMAVDLLDGKPRKWMVENSWGATSGYKGHIIMSDKWFEEYVFRLVVEKKYVPEKLQKLSEQKPTMLPAWDPLYQEDL